MMQKVRLRLCFWAFFLLFFIFLSSAYASASSLMQDSRDVIMTDESGLSEILSVDTQPVLSQQDNLFFGTSPSISRVIFHVAEFMDTFKLRPDDVLVVFDWDNTISALNGSSLPLREGPLTRNTIKTLMEKGIPVMILTSRLMGAPVIVMPTGTATIDAPTFSTMISCGNNMMSALNLPLPPIFNDSVYNYYYPDNELRFGQHIPSNALGFATLVYHNIVFAGTPTQSIKGNSLTYLIDQKFLKQAPRLIIFIDNDIHHIESMMNAFKGRSEYVIGLYFPQKEEEIQGKVSILTP